jgi:hypothetical protein
MKMKRVDEKFKRIVKYWRVRYQQASSQDRLLVSMYTLMVLIYAWWVFMVF